MNIEEERDYLRTRLRAAEVALERSRKNARDPQFTCGWRGLGAPPCMEHAIWYGAFLVGAWLTMTPLCETHARTWHLTSKAYADASRAMGGAVANVSLRVQLMEEILSLKDNTLYGEVRSRLVWNCDECGLPIVRSLESGEWILVGEAGIVTSTIAKHEHRPG